MEQKTHQTRNQDTWVLAWSLPLTCCVTLVNFCPSPGLSSVWDRTGRLGSF